MAPFASLRAPQVTPIGRRAPHRVAYALMGRIKAGVFCPGDWLPTEREILREFPVSRTALREALIILECLGLIESARGGGSRVIGRSPKSSIGSAISVDLITLLEACSAFEAEAAGLAAGLAAADGGRLALPGVIAPGPLTAELCGEFHIALAAAIGNAAVSASIENLWRLAARRPALRGLFDIALAHSGREVRALQAKALDAVSGGSPSASRRAVTALFAAYVAAVVAFEEQEPSARNHMNGAHGRR